MFYTGLVNKSYLSTGKVSSYEHVQSIEKKSLDLD